MREADRIRLLELSPGAFGTPIHCSLAIIHLTSFPRYEALSYVWGDGTMKKNIKICGHGLPITTNLETALRHLRLPDEPRNLWIDAIWVHYFNRKISELSFYLSISIYLQ
jgi:hypothetical protein